MIRILLVEDDENLRESLKGYLSREGMSVEAVGTLGEFRKAISCGAPSVVIFDWMLPDGQGIDGLRELRRTDTATPVIFLTARAELIDKVLGLESGANDYLTKPFEPRELVARVRVQLRVSVGGTMGSEPELVAGEIRMFPRSMKVLRAEEPVELTRMEFSLLRLLIENPNRVFSRDELLNRVWGYDSYPTTRTVDTHVLQLRNKFGSELIETVRGVGYRLKETKK